MADDTNEKKLFIDDDWKSRVEKEKEELAKEQQKKAQEEEGPPLTPFLAHVESMAIQTMMALGLVPHPAAGNKRILDPGQARYLIDTLVMLKEKTKGNLDTEEQAYMDRVLPELQMTFVEVMKAVSKAQAEGRLKTSPEEGPAGSAIPGFGGIPGAGGMPLA